MLRVCVCGCVRVSVCVIRENNAALLDCRAKPCHGGQGTGSPAKLVCWVCSSVMVTFRFFKGEAQRGEPDVPRRAHTGPTVSGWL